MNEENPKRKKGISTGSFDSLQVNLSLTTEDIKDDDFLSNGDLIESDDMSFSIVRKIHQQEKNNNERIVLLVKDESVNEDEVEKNVDGFASVHRIAIINAKKDEKVLKTLNNDTLYPQILIFNEELYECLILPYLGSSIDEVLQKFPAFFQQPSSSPLIFQMVYKLILQVEFAAVEKKCCFFGISPTSVFLFLDDDTDKLRSCHFLDFDSAEDLTAETQNVMMEDILKLIYFLFQSKFGWEFIKKMNIQKDEKEREDFDSVFKELPQQIQDIKEYVLKKKSKDEVDYSLIKQKLKEVL